MKIRSIDVYVVKTPLDIPFAFSQGWVKQRAATLLKITTDSGTEGWGEAFAQGLEPPEISATAISHALAPLILGKDALSPVVLWQAMYNQTRDHGRKGSVMSAIRAVDIALWDICGKHYGVPISSLLGGACRQSVQPYATGFYRLTGKGESVRLAEEAIAHKEAGFQAMKIKLGFGVRDDIEVMHAIANVVDVKSIDLMLDTNHAYGRRDAIRLGQALSEFDLRWYEEPVIPEDIEGYAEVRKAVNLPIAGGEQDSIAEPWVIDNGRVAIPDKPGLGIDINMDTIEQFKTVATRHIYS